MTIACRLSRRSGRIATAQKSPITTTGMYVHASSKNMTPSNSFPCIRWTKGARLTTHWIHGVITAPRAVRVALSAPGWPKTTDPGRRRHAPEGLKEDT